MHSKKIFLIGILLFYCFNSQAVNTCKKVVRKKSKQELIKIVKRKSSLYENREPIEAVELLYGMKGLATRNKLKDILIQLSRFEEPLHQDTLYRILHKVKKNKARKKGRLFRELLILNLVPFHSEAQAIKKVDAFLTGKGTLKSALGDMTLKQLHKHVYGKDIQNPHPNSVLARFLLEAEESLGEPLVSEMRRFVEGRRGRKRGDEKLFISIPEDAFDIFSKYFLNEKFITHTHSQNQGTLYMSFNKESLSYSGFETHGETRIQGEGAIWPTIFLSSKESQRAQLYFELGAMHEDYAKEPWKLIDENGRAYVKQGGYNCCTHWFSEMPIGEKLVERYRFPGNVDKHASKRDISKKPVVSKIGKAKYHSDEYDDYDEEYDDIMESLPRLTNLVWKTKRSNMPLWQMLDLKESQDNAELTNPGYTLYALIGKVNSDRVPIVFTMAEEAGTKLPSDNKIRESISEY